MSTVHDVDLRASEGPSPCRPSTVRVRLFGQFLIDEGRITHEELSEALQLMATCNVTVGDLAVERGLISRLEAEKIHHLQRSIDRRWGEIALTLGIGTLTADVLEELGWEQQRQNLRLTDALVELDFMTSTEVDALFRRFEAEQATSTSPRIPSAWRRGATQVLLDGIPRIASRVLRSPARIGGPRPWDGEALAVSARTELTSPYERLDLGFTVAEGVAACMAERLIAPVVLTSMEHAVAEFIAIVVEHVKRRIEAECRRVVETREIERRRLPKHGLAFDLALHSGHAILVVARTPPRAS